MKLFEVLKIVTSHPLTEKNKLKAIGRFIKWQIGSRLNPYPVIYPFTNKAKLVIERGMTAATGNIYCGLHEFNDMSFLLHVLREDDQFVDIGANIGSYTVLASAHSGANTICFEPHPSTFRQLMVNIRANQIENKTEAYNLALGSANGEINFTSSAGAANHVARAEDKNIVKVPVETLDAVMKTKKPPVVMKIDVEGFETEVINGGFQTISAPSLQAVIIELRGHGARYGFDEQKLHDKLVSLSYQPYEYDGFTRKLSLLKSHFGAENTIYIRNLDFVNERIASAPQISMLGYNF